jgi:MFS family permease
MTLLPIVAAVFVAYLVIGIALPVLPLHVHQRLGLGTFVVGLVAGSQFGASLLSRLWAGHQSDTRGAKRAVVVGLVAASASGLLYLLSLAFIAKPVLSVTVLLLGRALLGGAESFIVMGAMGWGLALTGTQNTGKVMSWVGIAMYAAFAIGAPLGTALYARYGFASVGVATAIVPLVTLVLVATLRAVPPSSASQVRVPFSRVLGAVWLPGLGLALSSVGYGSITTFIVLLFAQRGWSDAWIALTVASGVFMFGRVLFGHLPDKVGGPKVAIISVLIEAAGQGLVWFASSPAMIFAGAALAGFGYALVYPAFGVEAARRSPPESRGLAMGAYTACLDLALGIASPALGLIANAAGLEAVFLTSTLIVLCAVGVAAVLLFAPQSEPALTTAQGESHA